jgi:hypothetical protein
VASRAGCPSCGGQLTVEVRNTAVSVLFAYPLERLMRESQTDHS